ncbi:cobalt-precorrin-6A reductase [Proteinivorax tanatarense]|uniref:Cobalt-precorrin-6A reductase n=1 Tax=Proteinivorax tanatarense TaxID=1260629 RepID=A0AAU7VJT7_9FIRM
MIWVMSGTKDGRNLINRLADKGYKMVITTATQYGSSLIPQTGNMKIITQRLTAEQMELVIAEHDIKILVDATHPYATSASQNAILACKSMSIKYVRYERPSILEGRKFNQSPKLKRFPDVKKAAQWLKNKKGNILLTTGSKNLEEFTQVIERKRLYIRVLPSQGVIGKCEMLGFNSSQIIAMEGPFTQQMNQQIYKHFAIQHMVTKDSGDVGGTNEKLTGAILEGVTPIIIDRPKINYPNISSKLDDVLEYVEKYYS